jgi:hypothetical protein
MRALAILALLVALFSANTPDAAFSARVHTIRLADAGLAGFFLGVASGSGVPTALVATDARTGRQRLFWPDTAALQARAQASALQRLSLAQFRALEAPAYSEATRSVAFIAQGDDGAHSIWVGRVQVGSDGWLHIAGAGPREVRVGCQPCDTLAWSPSGAWLLYDGATGLVAVSARDGTSQAITSEAHDRWPACSPDGRSLAYQDALDGITVLSAHDCLPAPGAAARYLNGYTPAWHVSWSPDGRRMAFASKRSDTTGVYVAASDQLSDTQIAGGDAAAVLVSGQRCEDPIWVPAQQTAVHMEAPTEAATEAFMEARTDLVAYVCASPGAVDQFSALVVVPVPLAAVSGGQPAWQAVLQQRGATYYNMCWIPSSPDMTHDPMPDPPSGPVAGTIPDAAS